MERQDIKAIIFDLGNVLVDFDHTIAAKRISPFTDKTIPQIFDLFFNSDITGRFEAGRLAPHDFFAKVKEMLNLRLDYDDFVPIWNEIFFLSEKNHLVYQLAQKLKPSYKLALLSNVNVLHFEYLKRNFSVFDTFHAIVTSFQLGVTKPDPSIYQKTLEILEVPAQRVVYTDDRPELVDSAKQLGIRGFVFKGIEQFKRDLQALGVSVYS